MSNHTAENGEVFYPGEEIREINPSETEGINKQVQEIFNRSEIQNSYIKQRDYEADFNIGDDTGEESFYLSKPKEEEGFAIRSNDNFEGANEAFFGEDRLNEFSEEEDISGKESENLRKIIGSTKNKLKGTASFEIKSDGVFRIHKNELSNELESEK